MLVVEVSFSGRTRRKSEIFRGFFPMSPPKLYRLFGIFPTKICQNCQKNEINFLSVFLPKNGCFFGLRNCKFALPISFSRCCANQKKSLFSKNSRSAKTLLPACPPWRDLSFFRGQNIQLRFPKMTKILKKWPSAKFSRFFQICTFVFCQTLKKVPEKHEFFRIFVAGIFGKKVRFGPLFGPKIGPQKNPFYRKYVGVNPARFWGAFSREKFSEIRRSSRPEKVAVLRQFCVQEILKFPLLRSAKSGILGPKFPPKSGRNFSEDFSKNFLAGENSGKFWDKIFPGFVVEWTGFWGNFPGKFGKISPGGPELFRGLSGKSSGFSGKSVGKFLAKSAEKSPIFPTWFL